MEQVTKTLPAIAPVAQAPATQAKPASKAKPRNAQAPKAEQAPKAIKYCMLQGYRPRGGSALFAHTAAALELFGMDKGASIPKARLATVLGDTAVKHHLNTTGFLAQDEHGVTVSDLGKDAFLLRHVDPEEKAAFIEILTTGKTEKPLPVSYTNPKGIKAI